jgi:hypothetical protein
VTDYAGPLQRLALSGTLWAIGAPPLLAFAWHVVAGRRIAAGAREAGDVARSAALARSVGVGSILAAAAVTVAHDLAIVRGRAAARGSIALIEPILRCARIGQLDLGIDLLFDKVSAVACGLVCVVALAASGLMARARATPAQWRSWAWLELTVAGALLSSEADGFVTAALGWALVMVACAWLVSWTDARAAVATAGRGAAAIAAMVFAASLLFWGMGGAWREGQYVPDPRSRVAAVRADEEGAGTAAQGADEDSDDAAPGLLTFTSLQGATVFIDEARLPSVHAPFVRVAIPSGSHVLRVHPGGSSPDAVVGPLTVTPGESIALVELGPSLSFREIAAQLVVRDAGNEYEAREALAGRGSPLGPRLVAVALAVLALAAAAMTGTWLSRDVPPEIRFASRAVAFILGPALLARVSFLAPLVDPVRGGRVVLIAVAAVIVIAIGLSRRGAGIEQVLFVRTPERIGALVMSFERWVIDAIAGAMASLVRAAAWTADRLDAEALGGPSDAAAASVVRLGRITESLTGQPVGRAAWALVVVLASIAIGHAVWPSR